MKLGTNVVTDPIDETEFNEVHALFNELGLHYIPNNTNLHFYINGIRRIFYIQCHYGLAFKIPG
jgi:hypothetical protein